MTKRRNYSFLQKTMNEMELEDFCRKIATEYAKLPQRKAVTYFTEKYDITKSCFYRILNIAVKTNLVSREIIRSMEAKAIANQRSHASYAGRTSVEHYEKLRKERDEYIIKGYTDMDIKEIAEDFARSTNETKLEFANKYDIGIHILNILLKKAFVEGIADDETCMAIQNRSLAKSTSDRNEKFFEHLWNLRNSNKK